MLRQYSLLILISFILAGCDYFDPKTTIYQPLKLEKDSFEIRTELINAQHFNRVENVLKFYNVKYKRTGETEINFSASISKDLIWNYTSKAENSDWLKTHLKQ